jgi:hypothetical protein
VNHASSCKNTNKFKMTMNNGKRNYFWPKDEGCADTAEEFTVKARQKFDRFGGEGGNFVSPIDIQTYSYASRALPYLRLENSSGTSCNNVYKNERAAYKDYHIYEAQVDIPGVKKCTAAAFYNKPGQAIQWKFPKRIFQMIASGEIKEIPATSIPKFM